MTPASSSALDELVAALPEGAVLLDPDVTAGYRQDWAADPTAGHPAAVVRATCTE
ncbi:FAD-binding oxidoreductase, partial [Halomonas sp. ND22Bw]